MRRLPSWWVLLAILSGCHQQTAAPSASLAGLRSAAPTISVVGTRATIQHPQWVQISLARVPLGVGPPAPRIVNASTAIAVLPAGWISDTKTGLGIFGGDVRGVVTTGWTVACNCHSSVPITLEIDLAPGYAWRITTTLCTGTREEARFDLGCAADVTHDEAVTVEDQILYLRWFEAGDLAADLDDGTGSGAPDGGVDINDVLFFLKHYEAGC